MKTRMKQRWKALAPVALGLALVTGAGAVDTDSLTVTITPNAAYSLTLSTTAVSLNLGTVALSASTQTVSPSTVTVTGTYAATGLKLRGSMGGSGTPWTFSINTAVAAKDELATWAVFTDTSVVSYTTVGSTGSGSAYFIGTSSGVTGSNVVGTNSQQVGTGAGPTSFIANAGSAGYKTMASLPSNIVDSPASKAHLWLRFTLPPTTTDNNPKLVTFTLLAGAAN